MEQCKNFGPPVQGGFRIFFHELLFQFVVSNLFHVLEVGKKVKSKFSNLSPLPTNSNMQCAIYTLLITTHSVLFC